MEFRPTHLQGLTVVQPVVFGDHRGFFLETYVFERFREAGIASVFTQDNHSCSREAGVLRGLHFQNPPFAQSKLVRATRGSVFDVAVDLRSGSSTFGEWFGITLSAENFTMLFVPAGFAHGFCTLEPDTHVQYKVDAPYSPTHDSGIIWNDPRIAVDWPVGSPILSAKDSALPQLSERPSPFK